MTSKTKCHFGMKSDIPSIHENHRRKVTLRPFRSKALLWAVISHTRSKCALEPMSAQLSCAMQQGTPPTIRHKRDNSNNDTP